MKRLSFIFFFGLVSTGILNAQTVLFTNQNQSEVACYRIPSIVTATNGTLIAAIDQRVENCGDLHLNNDINIQVRTSKDKGKTWSAAKTAIDFPWGQSASDPSMVVDKQTKEIIMFYNYMNLEKSKGEYRYHISKSKDYGETWSEPEDITSQIKPADWQKDFTFITSGRGFQTSEGWLVNTLVHLNDGVYLIISKDHGKTWERLPAVAKEADETNFVELPNGDWMLNARIRDLGFRKIFISKDKGQSWNVRVEEQLEDATCNASTLVYNGKVYFSNLQVKNSNERKNLGLKVSSDNGQTWTKIKTIEPGSTAYSVLTPISKKKLGIFYEKNGYKDNVFEVIKLK